MPGGRRQPGVVPIEIIWRVISLANTLGELSAPGDGTVRRRFNREAFTVEFGGPTDDDVFQEFIQVLVDERQVFWAKLGQDWGRPEGSHVMKPMPPTLHRKFVEWADGFLKPLSDPIDRR